MNINTILKLNEKEFFTIDEVIEKLEDIVGIDKLNDAQNHQDKININHFFYWKEFLLKKDNGKIYEKKPNIYVRVNKCKCDYLVTHAGILYILENIDEVTLFKEDIYRTFY